MNNTDTPCDFLKEAKRALNMGENFLAYDLAEKSPDANGKPSPEKIHIMSLSLARSGSLSRAKEIAALLPETDDESSINICGLKSRLIKDTAVATLDPNERRQRFFEAAQRASRSSNPPALAFSAQEGVKKSTSSPRAVLSRSLFEYVFGTKELNVRIVKMKLIDIVD